MTYEDATLITEIEWPPTLRTRIIHATYHEGMRTVGDLRCRHLRGPGYQLWSIPNVGNKCVAAMLEVIKAEPPETDPAVSDQKWGSP